MATFSVMADVPNPLFDSNGNPFSGAVLKAFEPGTTNVVSIAIDSAGGSPQTSISYNAQGKLEVTGNEILPYIDRKHKWGIFSNQTNADANTPFYMGPFDNVDFAAGVAVSYDQGGTGSVSRTITSRLQDIVSVKDFGAVGGAGATDDTVAVQSAVTHANTNGTILLWPDGTYLTTSSITNLHDVKHIGEGVIKRGTDLFPVEPRKGDSNTIFVTTGGLDANDGLSSSEPFLTIDAALTVLVNYGPVLGGTWTVDIAAGTYIESGASLAENLRSVKRILIKGAVAGHPTVPTTIIDGSTGLTNQHALTSNIGNFVEYRDLKAINFTHSDNATGGFLAQLGADLLVTNCHATGSSFFGVFITAGSHGRIAGGIYDGNRNNINFNDSNGTVGQGATSRADGPISKNATESGVFWTRGSQGHVDFTTFDGDLAGLVSNRACRVADVECEFKNCGTAIRTRTGGFVAADKTNVYNIGTGDANTTLFDFGAYSGPLEELLERTSTGFEQDARSTLLIARDLRDNAHTGDTVRTIVATPFTMPAGYFTDGGVTSLIGRKLHIKLSGFRTGTAGTCSVGVDFGGSEGLTLAMVGTDAEDWDAEFEIWAQGSATQFLRGTIKHGTGGTEDVRRFGRFTRFINMETDKAIQVIALLTDAGDTMTVETIEFFMVG